MGKTMAVDLDRQARIKQNVEKVLLPWMYLINESNKKVRDKTFFLSDIQATLSTLTGWTRNSKPVHSAIFLFPRTNRINWYVRKALTMCSEIFVIRYPIGFNPNRK